MYMSLWDELPASLRNSGELDSLRPLLDGLNGTGPTPVSDADGNWSEYSATEDLHGPLSLDPQTGGFSHTPGNSSTPIEFPDPRVTVALAFHLDGPGGNRDGGWRVVLSAPSALLRLPFLRGAMLDPQGQLRADPANPVVRFTLPALRIRVQQLAGSSVNVTLLSATTGGPPVDQIYDFIRMDPPYALVGPSDVVGFAFRTAVLDLSGTAGPSGVPATARAMPGDWQGLYLPEARLFVAPSGLEGIAVSAGVRDMWIGIGAHAGVTGVFEAEVVNRGGHPTITVRFQSDTGAWIEDPGTNPADLPEHSTLFVDTAGGLAPVSIRITVDGGAAVNDDRARITTPIAGTVTVSITATDGAGNPTTRVVTAHRGAGSSPAGSSGTTVSLRTTSNGSHRLELVSQTTTSAVLRLNPEADATWTWSGGTHTGSTAEVPVGAGATVAVQAVLTAVAPKVIDAFALFDRPTPAQVPEPRPDSPPQPQTSTLAWAELGTNLRSGPAGTRTDPGSSPTVLSTLAGRLTDIGAATKLTVDGYASFEGDDSTAQRDRNMALSERRRDALIHLLRAHGFTNVVVGTAYGHTKSNPASPTAGSIDSLTADPTIGAAAWWRARASTDASSAETVTGELTRPAAPVISTVDPRPPQTARPDCFRKIGVRVELVRGTFIRGEVYGEFDIETAAEAGFARKGQPAIRSGPRNPSDGICTFLVRLRIAEDQNSWNVTAEFRALDSDLDGLAKMDSAHADQTALDVLGALTVLAPLTSATTELSPAAGALVALGSVALGASDLLHTQSIILRGGELVVSDGIVGADGTTTVSDHGVQVSVLLDVEVAFTFDLGIIRVDPAHPITTRYKAVGVRSQWGTNAAPGGVEYVPLPVFDPSRGYSLDIPTGSLTAVPPLDNVLRILGVKVSRDNPTYLEVEVGLGLDLGILKIDTVRVRGRLDGPPLDLQITKFGATLDIPGTLHGSGWVAINEGGFEGAFDLTIIPVNIRGSASLAVHSEGGVTGVLVGVDVQFPVPLLLGNSGLGIFGFLGGVGINYARKENHAVQVPALAWLQEQLPRQGGVMDPAGWKFDPGHYAFAAGMLLGTVDGGFVLHLKGIVVIEVPGPRLLLVMKADVLSLPPVLKDANQNATFLAVLDIDFGQGTIQIGIVAAYEIKSILKVRVPVTAFFDTHHPEKWLVELGNYDDRVTVEVLDVISGSGYLMVHGDGVSIPVLPSVSHGIAVATGFHIQCVLMGSKSVGLYLEVAAGFDAILGLDPFYLAGKIYVRGELRLFIVSIGASAELTVMVGTRIVNGVRQDQPYVHGEVCGEVDFFFFSVKGCVSLTIGEEPDATPEPQDLVAGVSLVSRSPALVEGSGAGRQVDGKIADARSTVATTPDAPPSVPLDAIPVIQFNSAPTATGNIVLGEAPFGSSGAASNPWTRIGDRWWRYELLDVTLHGPLQPGGATAPSTWWTGGTPADPTSGPSLALLDWLPTPFSRAVPYGEALKSQVGHRWGTVCDPPAPPVSVLWTFDDKPTGPSSVGWNLTPIPLPDPSSHVRTSPVEARLHVDEPWRTGDDAVDRMQGTAPAVVVGDAVPCPGRGHGDPVSPMKSWVVDQPLTMSAAAAVGDHVSLRSVAELLADGTSLADLSAELAQQSWTTEMMHATDPDLRLGCLGRVLRSPQNDIAEPAPRGTETDRERVKQVWSETGFRPDELGDAVRMTCPDGLSEFSVLLLVPERALGKALVVRSFDDAGTPVHEHRVSTDDLLSGTHPLPPDWVDPDKPWAGPVERAGRIAARIASGSRQGLMLVLVTMDGLPGETTEIVIGWDRALVKDRASAFWVIAMSALPTSERRRHSWDSTVVTSEQTALSNALTQDPSNVPLLVPGQSYTVDVTWRATSMVSNDPPSAALPGPTPPADTWTVPHTQSFTFTADGVDEAPDDLTPWLLATTPGPHEVGIFCKEPVRIALSTQAVVRLFDAYDKELRVVVRAASGKHPEPPTGGGPGSPLTIAVDPTMFAFGHTGATFGVQPPWIEVLGEIIGDMPCVGVDEATSHDYTITLPYDFEPLTDYLVDVHAVPKGAPANATGLIHRIGFTTSRFATVEELAGYIAPAAVHHRVVLAPTALRDPATLPTTPAGSQLDAAFQAAGLAAPQTPDYPAVEVLWSADAVPQPVAVVVECSEAMWRSRQVPTVVPAPPDASDPSHKWWAARPAPWLHLEPAAAGPGLAGIDRIVQGPGGTRAVVLLAPNSRGTEVHLDLVSAADALAQTPEKRTTAVRVSLHRAPWEVED